MSDSPDSTKSQPVSLPRIAIGAMVMVQLALAAVALLSGNYLSATHFKTRDLTRLEEFTLSSSTRKLLSSDQVRNRERPIKLIVAVRKTSHHYTRLRAIAGEFGKFANGKLDIEFVDPMRDADRAFEIAETYNNVFFEDICIVDARPEGEPKPATDETNGEDAPSPHIRFIPVEEMIVRRTDARNRRVRVGYQDEDLLSSAIIGAIEGTPRRVYFLADKSQLQDSSEDTPWSILSGTLLLQNVQLTPIQLADIDAIPDDAEGVALVAPRYDLDEREMGILRNYWSRPKSSLLVILDPFHRPERLRAFLREHGITPRNDRILTARKQQTTASVRAVFTYGAQLNRINTDLSGKSTIFEGGTSSLEVREGAEDLLNRRIFPIALIQAAAGYWGETKFDEENPVFAPGEDHGDPSTSDKPLYLAAGVIRGNETDDETAGQASRMVVVSNSAFLHPERLRAKQVDFLRNSSHWLLGREELIGIGPHPVARYKLNLIQSQVTFINRLNLFFIPGVLLLAGIAVWNLRRA